MFKPNPEKLRFFTNKPRLQSLPSRSMLDMSIIRVPPNWG
jgi:hypothetical protein